jgi:hypothetical protein
MSDSNVVQFSLKLMILESLRVYIFRTSPVSLRTHSPANEFLYSSISIHSHKWSVLHGRARCDSYILSVPSTVRSLALNFVRVTASQQPILYTVQEGAMLTTSRERRIGRLLRQARGGSPNERGTARGRLFQSINSGGVRPSTCQRHMLKTVPRSRDHVVRSPQRLWKCWLIWRYVIGFCGKRNCTDRGLQPTLPHQSPYTKCFDQSPSWHLPKENHAYVINRRSTVWQHVPRVEWDIQGTDPFQLAGCDPTGCLRVTAAAFGQQFKNTRNSIRLSRCQFKNRVSVRLRRMRGFAG